MEFWKHVRHGEVRLRDAHTSIFQLAADEEAAVADYLIMDGERVGWDIMLRIVGLRVGEDFLSWKSMANESFRVKSFYQLLVGENNISFPK